jgi:hypothetical protein
VQTISGIRAGFTRHAQHVSQQQPNKLRNRAAFIVGANSKRAEFLFGEPERDDWVSRNSFVGPRRNNQQSAAIRRRQLH